MLVANSDALPADEVAVAVTTWLKPTEIGKNSLKVASPSHPVVIEYAPGTHVPGPGLPDLPWHWRRSRDRERCAGGKARDRPLDLDVPLASGLELTMVSVGAGWLSLASLPAFRTIP